MTNPGLKVFNSFNLSSISIFSILAMQIFVFVLYMSPYCVESIDADYIQYLFCVLLGITFRIQGNTREQIIWPGGGGSTVLLHFPLNFFTSLGTQPNFAQVRFKWLFSYFSLYVDPLNLESQNQAENIPLLLPSSPIKVWGRSVKGFLSYDTNKETEITTCRYIFRCLLISGKRQNGETE